MYLAGGTRAISWRTSESWGTISLCNVHVHVYVMGAGHDVVVEVVVFSGQGFETTIYAHI